MNMLNCPDVEWFRANYVSKTLPFPQVVASSCPRGRHPSMFHARGLVGAQEAGRQGSEVSAA